MDTISSFYGKNFDKIRDDDLATLGNLLDRAGQEKAVIIAPDHTIQNGADQPTLLCALSTALVLYMPWERQAYAEASDSYRAEFSAVYRRRAFARQRGAVPSDSELREVLGRVEQCMRELVQGRITESFNFYKQPKTWYQLVETFMFLWAFMNEQALGLVEGDKFRPELFTELSKPVACCQRMVEDLGVRVF